MAGYYINSLDWPKFCALVERPTQRQLTVLAMYLAEGLEDLEGEFDAKDPVLRWPRDPKALRAVVAQRLALPDWYGDLSRWGKELWERTIDEGCKNRSVGFRGEGDPVYWDVIDIAHRRLGVHRPGMAGQVALANFGTVPFRYRPPTEEELWLDWSPMHSMHPPDEVQRLCAELRSVGPAIEASGNRDVWEQYQATLLPAIERVADQRRLLHIVVDT